MEFCSRNFEVREIRTEGCCLLPIADPLYDQHLELLRRAGEIDG